MKIKFEYIFSIWTHIYEECGEWDGTRNSNSSREHEHHMRAVEVKGTRARYLFHIFRNLEYYIPCILHCRLVSVCWPHTLHPTQSRFLKLLLFGSRKMWLWHSTLSRLFHFRTGRFSLRDSLHYEPFQYCTIGVVSIFLLVTVSSEWIFIWDDFFSFFLFLCESIPFFFFRPTDGKNSLWSGWGKGERSRTTTQRRRSNRKGEI